MLFLQHPCGTVTLVRVVTGPVYRFPWDRHPEYGMADCLCPILFHFSPGQKNLEKVKFIWDLFFNGILYINIVIREKRIEERLLPSTKCQPVVLQTSVHLKFVGVIKINIKGFSGGGACIPLQQMGIRGGLIYLEN